MSQGTSQKIPGRPKREDRGARAARCDRPGHMSLEFERYTFTGPSDLLAAPLSSTAMVLYLILANCYPKQAGEVTVATEYLARQLGICRQTLYRRILELAAGGWVRILSRGPRCTRLALCNPVLAEREAEVERVRTRLNRARFGGEALMKEWLNLLVDSSEYDDNARPGFLRNPLTGENLEYDRWYAAGVAFEFNGPQHYHPTDIYPDPRQVDETKARDLIKKGISHDQGVVLITVEPQDLTLKGMQAKIGKYLPLRKVRPDDPVLRFLVYACERYVSKAAGKGQRKKSRFS